ncbi:MAG: DUF5063 domain-containing protein [Bacteroidales bacterium]|jgi:hypothetical protein|nr:DUF5063 domain-containing protein [Bacteroidales bacterium]
MNQEISNKPVYSQNVIEFVTIANEYCKFVENTSRFSKKDFLLKTQTLLPLLYLKAVLLPSLETIGEQENEKFVDENAWNYIYNMVKTKLGYHNEYPEIFDPLTKEQEMMSSASLSDNFADIYQDLKNFISLFAIGNEDMMNDGVWECKLNFDEFWGQKLVNAIRAIHIIISSKDNLNEDNEDGEEKNEDVDMKNIDTSSWILSKKQSDYKNE